MALVLLGYQKLIESGADEVKNTLLASIECNKEKLLNELKQIKNIMMLLRSSVALLECLFYI